MVLALALGLAGVSGAAGAAVAVPSPSARTAVPLPVEQLFDNRAISDDARPEEADFDGAGGSLSARTLTAAGWTPGRELTVQGARLTWPGSAPGEPDNVRAAGQRVRVTGRGDALAFLVAGTAGADTGGTGTVGYADGSRSSYVLTAPDWRTGPLATKAVALPYRNTPSGTVAERVRLYAVTVPLPPGREVASVDLPHAPDLHVFAVSVRSASAGWTGSWARSTGGYAPVGPWTDRTLRLVVHTSAGGPRVRVRLDNTFAAAPVRIGAATVAVRGTGAAPRGTPVRLAFGGATGVQIPAGAQAVSDPLGFTVPADADLLVSLHLPGTVTAVPVHQVAIQTSYLGEPGDHSADTSAAAFTGTLTSFPLLTGVDVGGGPGSVVAFGDSITDGHRSTPDANRRWPDVLADRLLGQSEVPRYGVLNQGIGGNRVVTDRYTGDGVSTDQSGVSALHRLDRDVFAQTSVRTVVVLEGVNDLLAGTRAEQITAGLAEIAERAHARGLRVLAATITPCEGWGTCTAAVESERAAVNAWVRTAGVFDAMLDFDAVVRDPARPTRILPEYDGGDHLHPGDAGLAAMAGAVDLRLL
ncbi:SGNH/GDSL hydrolase family protein [Streptomyces sp. XM83C]|uniref:SGNH/GDSL hydrolase family protein n=1 Tax=unclassified Streptomyces TaxID=2593676 RepID=UPI001FF92A0C|nr:SGNH/GDSL hydrolase family protein [Streptomyces sp. XM83C]MCK1820248.1 SGNH/GDSL hydrolase family protein [Streptomyces sp. XM83C]